jgi:prevent-host-death family protein
MSDSILVVEGFEEVDTYSSSLERAGFTITRSRSDAALSVVERRPFSAVVASIAAISGLELVKRIHATRSDLPILAVGSVDVMPHFGDVLFLLEAPVVGRVFVEIMKLFVRNLRTRRAWRDLPWEMSVSATEAKNEFATILDTAVSRGPVRIEKHGAARAVLVAWDDYEKLTAAPDRLGALSTEYDALLARLQQPEMYDRLQAAFDASPAELSAAATKRRKRGG